MIKTLLVPVLVRSSSRVTVLSLTLFAIAVKSLFLFFILFPYFTLMSVTLKRALWSIVKEPGY